ncbi:TetR/AcrR family transcriptional regulator [Mycolicibacterium sp. Dal123E01]|uniref:TetR/AcrR family transcriptional regulator n=1 Tax=Mycolicibacterium sp. Dal123E01 TaxID=3457578 RepID=UPI00403EB672
MTLADYSHSRGRPTIAPSDRFRPRKQPRQVRAAETQQRILDAAAQVFAEYGYAAGTTNRIADRAQVSIGSLYQYFPNKDAVLRALMQAHADAGARLIAERTADGLPAPLEEALRVFVRATIDNHRDDPRLHRVLFEEAPRAPAFLAHLHEMERRAVEGTAALLQALPSVRDGSRLTAHIVVTTIESLVHRLVTTELTVDLAELEDEIVVLLGGYLRRRSE